MTHLMGVAISTTGHEHRLHLLQQACLRWKTCLPYDALMYVTVDGSEAETEWVRRALGPWRGEVFQVGGPAFTEGPVYRRPDRLGVAANKNTGLELLMRAGVEHLFLSDDDSWPLYEQSITKHVDLGLAHSMVCWGRHRLDPRSYGNYATWTWPRGSVLYSTRGVVETVGGMDERFGPGGHEHVEWSQRIHNAGLTPAPYCSPFSYGTRNGMGAAALWHCEDMPRPGEKMGDHRKRRRELTSIVRTEMGWDWTNRVMAERQGSSDFVAYEAAANGRASATLCQNIPSQGAEESK